MSRRTAGICLICAAAFLFAAQFLTAAIFGSGVVSWNQEIFKSMMQATDHGLILWSKIAFSVGLFYLVWAEIEAFLGHSKHSVKHK